LVVFSQSWLNQADKAQFWILHLSAGGELMDEISEGAEGEEYYVIPEEAFGHLPPEWREELQGLAENGRAVLKSVDGELSKAARLSKALISVVSLKHIDGRLRAYKFQAELDAFLELEMLTTAFVVTYVRLFLGGASAGFGRQELPESLHAAHDQILDMRNRRFAHSDEHHSITDAMEIGFRDDQFQINPSIVMGFYVGGANEWHELVDFIDNLYAEKMEKLMAKLSTKTGHKWAWPKGPNFDAD
jgi:hypothetical protein